MHPYNKCEVFAKQKGNAMGNIAVIRSEGDLEVILLHESHELLAEIICPELYTIGGSPPDQQILFHTHATFNLFLILVVEFFAEGTQSAYIDKKYQNWSLLKGLRWFCSKYPDESSETKLENTVANLEEWLAREVPLSFWCPDVNIETEIRFNLKNNLLINFGANTAKHHLLRLSALLGKLENLCTEAGYCFSPQELSAVLASMIEELRSRLQYHSTHLAELLGNVFFSLNSVIKARYASNPTNRVGDMILPAGVTSSVFMDLYGSVLVFKNYDGARILKYTPVTTRFLKMRS